MMYKVSPKVTARTQPTPTSCWLTCLEMLFAWKNDKGDKSKKVGSILAEMDKSPNLFPYYMADAGIAPGECRETARMLGLMCAGDTKVIEAQTLTDVLKSHGPIWIAGRWYMEFDHVLVVTGCDPDTGKIKYINPWRNHDLSEYDGSVGWLSKRGNTWSNCDASIMYWR